MPVEKKPACKDEDLAAEDGATDQDVDDDADTLQLGKLTQDSATDVELTAADILKNLQMIQDISSWCHGTKKRKQRWQRFEGESINEVCGHQASPVQGSNP